MRPENPETDWDDKPGLPRVVIPVRFKVFWPFSARNPVSKVKGIGPKIKKLFNEKKIDTNIDLIFNFPYGLIDRTHCPKLNNLEIGKISTIFVKVKKHNFPRIRRLPNTVQCFDETGEINIVFFNSRENYIKIGRAHV